MEWRLADPLAVLIARHPTLRFEVLGSSAERCVNQLRSGGVDVAFGFEEAFANWSDLKLEPICEAKPVIYVRKGHPLAGQTIVTRSELAAYDCVTPSDSQTFGKTLRELFENEGVSWQRHLHIIDHQMIAQRLVARSNAFALTSEQVASASGFLESFDRLSIEELFTPFPICCATRARWELSRPVLAFLSIMRKVDAGHYEGFA